MVSNDPIVEDEMPDLFAYLNYDDEQLELLFNSTYADSNSSVGNMGLDMADTDHLMNSIFSFVDDSVPEEGPTIMMYTLVFLYTASFVCGLVGNFMALSVVFRCRRLNKTTIFLLFSLLISDLLVVTICLPFTMVTYVKGALVHGKVMCKLLPFAQGVAIFSGMFVLFMLLAQQFLGEARWSSISRVVGGYGTGLIVVLSWVSALLLSSPLLYVTKLRVLQLMGLVTVTMCQEIWPHAHSRHLYNISVFLLTYVIPVAAFGIGYLSMRCNRDKRRTQQDHQAPTRAEDLGNDQHQTDGIELNNCVEESPQDDSAALQTLASRMNAQRLLVWLIGMFALLWLPYHIVIIYLDVYAEDDSVTFLGTNVFPIVQWLALSCSAFRPVCYCILGTDFRSQLHRACCWPCNAERVVDHGIDTGLFAQRGQDSQSRNSRFEELHLENGEVELPDLVTVV